ncbi:MAG: adenylate/guanylate cyclase protein [Rhizobium sp.]|nr:adenylate/guanylate cyclase protein [Rhizobium sp.]
MKFYSKKFCDKPTCFLSGPLFRDVEIAAGIALHYGSVSYGNIGSGKRLDFTLIGPDVNMVSRIQGKCSDLSCLYSCRM